MSGSSGRSQKAVAKKNRIKSLQNDIEPLKEELGHASIAGIIIIIFLYPR